MIGHTPGHESLLKTIAEGHIGRGRPLAEFFFTFSVQLAADWDAIKCSLRDSLEFSVRVDSLRLWLFDLYNTFLALIFPSIKPGVPRCVSAYAIALISYCLPKFCSLLLIPLLLRLNSFLLAKPNLKCFRIFLFNIHVSLPYIMLYIPRAGVLIKHFLVPNARHFSEVNNFLF